MKLRVSTPVAVIVDVDDVRHIRAEDETGAFGILPGHAAFITVLSISVLTWRDATDAEHYIAVGGGILTVSDGNMVEVATREAVGQDELGRLKQSLLSRSAEDTEAETTAHTSATRLHLATIRQLQRFLSPNQRDAMRFTGDGSDHAASQAQAE